jgi:hypothetical protein
MPLGAKLWEQTSAVTVRRIVEVDQHKGVHTELSSNGEIRGFGRLDGMVGRVVATDDYWERPPIGDIIPGNARGLIAFQNGEMVTFQAYGIAKPVKRSPIAISTIVSVVQLTNPTPNISWMTETLVLWEAIVDEKAIRVNGTAYEWTDLTTAGAAAATPTAGGAAATP